MKRKEGLFCRIRRRTPEEAKELFDRYWPQVSDYIPHKPLEIIGQAIDYVEQCLSDPKLSKAIKTRIERVRNRCDVLSAPSRLQTMQKLIEILPADKRIKLQKLLRALKKAEDELLEHFRRTCRLLEKSPPD